MALPLWGDRSDRPEQGACCASWRSSSAPARAYGLPREFVDRRKQEKLRSAAALYLSRQELDCPARFDVAEVYWEEGKKPRIEYIENAF